MTKRREYSEAELDQLQVYYNYLFDYDGVDLIWKNPQRRNLIGKIAGCIHTYNGYRIIKVGKKYTPAHRVIYLMMTGKYPDIVDHIDGNILNNRLENLREANYFQNCCNAKKQKNNTSGVKGVSYVKNCKKWLARLRANRKIVFNQMYETKEEAIEAIKLARDCYHQNFAKHI